MFWMFFSSARDIVRENYADIQVSLWLKGPSNQDRLDTVVRRGYDMYCDRGEQTTYNVDPGASFLSILPPCIVL